MTTQDAYAAQSVPLGARLKRGLGAFFSGIGNALISYADARGRMSEIERYNNMSDAELAKLGLTREDIPRHVFRDMLA